ncbi:MAG: hypothetical protein ABEJ67_04875 [Halanaeroarchaeum sp.]
MTPIGDVVDGVLGRAFGRHATAARLAAMRQRYRGAVDDRDFETFVVRLYAASWVAFGLGAIVGYGLAARLPSPVQTAAANVLATLGVPAAVSTGTVLRALLAIGGGTGAKVLVVRLAGRVLAYRARRRRDRLERALPRTVRFMHVLSAGTTDERTLLAAVAERERTFGETARTFRRVLGTATVTGSVDRALRIVARDTPSRRTLAPFLLTFRARARDGPDALARFLHLESRMLARRDAQRTDAARRYFGLVVRLFVALLVVPVLLAGSYGLIAGFAVTERAPALPVERLVSVTALVTPVSAVVVLGIGAVASGLVFAVRPAGHRWSRFRTADSLTGLLREAPTNPASAFVLAAPAGALLLGWLWLTGRPTTTGAVVAYAAVAVPVGLVDWRRARFDAAKDRYLPDLVYGIARQVHLGRSFTEAVDHVAADGGLGPLDADVAGLAFDLRVAPPGSPVRATALDRFVDRVGTPLAERTVGMVAGALDAGTETAAAFDALQTEAGRLYHEEQAVSDRMALVVVVGWLVSLLLVVLVVAVDVAVLASATTGPTGVDEAPVAVATTGPAALPTFYLLTQATMLSSGWFAGVAGRGVYEGLLHSGALTLLAWLAFVGAGLL